MKKISLIAAVTTALFVAPSAFAAEGGGCHFHGHAPVKEATITGCANGQKNALVASGKLDASWKTVALEKAETIEGKKMKEWKFSYKNLAEKEAGKQTLYIFYTLTGNFIAANFTGQ
jgi:hypothetical protein